MNDKKTVEEQIAELREAKVVVNGLELYPIQVCVKAADTLERLNAVYQALDEYQARHGLVYADLSGNIDEAGLALREAIKAVDESEK